METKPESPQPDIARDATYYRAPDALRKRVRAAIAAETGERRTRGWVRGLGLGAAFAVVAAISWNVGTLQAVRPFDDAVTRDVVAAHVRSLQAPGRLQDVASSDQHTVKPWFAGRVDFVPYVVDLAAEGFPLTGGRVDYVDGRTVAVLTYGRRKHVVNVFEWSSTGPASEPRVAEVRGFAVVRWVHDGIAYAAVSDVARTEVEALAAALRAR